MIRLAAERGRHAAVVAHSSGPIYPYHPTADLTHLTKQIYFDYY
jgi:hypothetical protein